MQNKTIRRASALLLLPLLLAACGQTSTAPTGTAGTLDLQANRQQTSHQQARPGDWSNERIYFAVTDRFADGSAANNAGVDPSNPLGWHGGDLAGLKQKIDEGYFNKLGFTAIWISPVLLQVPAITVQDGVHKGKDFAGYHGYWAEDFHKLDPHFGTMKDLKDLVRAAHGKGLKVIQDVVVNHAGYGSSLVSKHPEWFHTQADCDAASNKDTDCALAGLPDFKQHLPEVRDYLNGFINHWVNATGIDGLRMDTMKHVPDTYWQEFFAAGGPGDPGRIWTVGEVYNGDPAVLAKYLRLGSPSVFDFALYFNIKDHLSNADGNLDNIANVFARDGAYPDARRLTTFIDNHDVKRFVNEVTDRGGSAQEATERLDLALSLIYTARGTPSVYYGTEIAMPGAGDPYDHPAGQTNREDMNFSAVPGAPTAARLTALNTARDRYSALARGTQQELWRPNGGTSVLAFRRTLPTAPTTVANQPVVVVMNGSDSPVNLADLPGGGIPLYGTFSGNSLTEVTGRASDLTVQDGKLTGTLPARSLLAVTGQAGPGSTTTVNPNLPSPTSLSAQAGDAAVKLTWQPAGSADITGYRVYQQAQGGTETQLNFAPLPADAQSFLARGLQNDTAYTFRVVSVDAQGAESAGVTTTATPSATNTAPVTFTVDALTQGNGQIELRRFDTGGQIEYPMTQEQRGIWKTTIDLPLFREVKFKFGNDASTAKNSGYEGFDQGDRTLIVGETTAYEGTYDFISVPVPDATVTGTVTGGGQPLANATVNTATNPSLHYGLTFADGTYVVRVPAGPTSLKAVAPGHAESAAQDVTAPATDVSFDLVLNAAMKYTLDGNLSDWTSPLVTLTSPDVGQWGVGNNWKTLRADADEYHLYLSYTYTVGNNGALLYLDVKDGGANSATTLDAWRQNADFATGVDYFIARWAAESSQLWQVVSSTDAEPAAGLQTATSTTDGQTVEVAIPWSALGGRPTRPINIYAGVFGGNYGAGDVVPNATSTPSGNNTVDSTRDFHVTFREPLVVTLP